MAKTKLPAKDWFGLAPLGHGLPAWGARALFKPSCRERPLDIPGDRQSWQGADAELRQVLSAEINDTVIPWMQKAAYYLDPTSGEEYCQHFSWHDGRVLVAEMCPNCSCGYLYVVVTLIDPKSVKSLPKPRTPVWPRSAAIQIQGGFWNLYREAAPWETPDLETVSEKWMLVQEGGPRSRAALEREAQRRNEQPPAVRPPVIRGK